MENVCLEERDNMYGLDAAILMNCKNLGSVRTYVAGFSDPLWWNVKNVTGGFAPTILAEKMFVVMRRRINGGKAF